MNKKTVFIKTAKCDAEGSNLSFDLKRALSLIDNKSTLDEVTKRAPPSLRDGLQGVLEELENGGFIRDRDNPRPEPKIKSPKITAPKMIVPKPASSHFDEELDFTGVGHSIPAGNAGSDAKYKADLVARARAELEAAVAAAKEKSNAEAHAKAEAQARLEAEKAARAKAAAEATAAAEALAKQKALMREQQDAQEAAARQPTVSGAAQMDPTASAKAEAEARIRAEIETVVRAKQNAELQAKRDAEAAQHKSEQESEAIKAALLAAAKAREEAEAEAARAKAELEAARARIEAEAKARIEAETARILAEQQAAARAKAEAEAKARAEAAAREKAEAEAKARAEAAARLKAEAEARLKAEAEAKAKARAEAAARAKAEAEAKARAEAAATTNMDPRERDRVEKDRAAEEEAAKLLAEFSDQIPESKNNREGDAKSSSKTSTKSTPAPSPSPAPAFEIKLDSYLGAPARPADDAGAKARKEEAQRSSDEMARLKSEAEAARQRAEAEARKQEEEKALAEEQAKAWAEAEQRAQAQAKIEAAQVAQQAVMTQAKTAMKSTPRPRRRPLPIAKIAAVLASLALITGIALPYLYPMQEFVAPIEQILAAQLKQPVHIGGISAASIPPRLKLHEITIGKSQQVKIGEADMNFDLLTLLSEVKSIGSVELRNIVIDGSQFDVQMASLKSLGGDRQYPVRHLDLKNLKIATEEIVVPGLSGNADIDEQGRFSRVSLYSEDNKYAIDLQPAKTRWQVSVSLKETSLPVMPGILFSDLSAKGELGDGEINFTEMDAHIFDGILLGSGKLKWNKGWSLQGQLEAKLFVLNKMFPKYGIEGEMYGQGTYSFSSAKLSRLGDAPRLDASFTAKRGVISAIDMVETARLGSREHLVGGRTHYDDMIGTVQLENRITHFRQLRIVSNILSARGSFDVLPDSKLSGNFNAEIKMRDGDNLLTLFGTLAEPKLRAGR